MKAKPTYTLFVLTDSRGWIRVSDEDEAGDKAWAAWYFKNALHSGTYCAIRGIFEILRVS